MAREIRCFSDCRARLTGAPEDCECPQRYQVELEDAKVDRLRDGED